MDFKKAVALIVLLAGGLLAYNLLTSGQLTLVPVKELSAEGRQIASLEERFAEVTHQLAQASRASGISGIDTTQDAEDAYQDLLQLEKEVQDLQSRSSSLKESDRNRIDNLLDRIQYVKKSQMTL